MCISTHDLMVAKKLELQDFLYEDPNDTGLGIKSHHLQTGGPEEREKG